MESTTLLREPDPTAVDAFAERIAGALNEAGMLLMASLGHRLGLFSALREADARRRSST